MARTPSEWQDNEKQLGQVRQTLDELERRLEQLPELPRKPVCVDLVLRLRLEINKILEAP